VSAVAGLYRGGGYHDGEEQSEGVHGDVSLAAFILS
jgi:hypothetical protein